MNTKQTRSLAEIIALLILIASCKANQPATEIERRALSRGTTLDAGGSTAATCDNSRTLTIAGQQQKPFAVTAMGDFVYFTDAVSHSIVRARKAGGNVTAMASTSAEPFSIAADATAIYWTERSAGRVMMMNIAGGPKVVLASGESSPNFIATDAWNVYWTSGAHGTSSGTVKGLTKKSGTIMTYATGQKEPWAIASDGTSLFWTTLGDGTIRSAPTAGGHARLLMLGLGNPVALVADDTSVYWAESGSGQILSASKMGGARTILASTGGAPWALTQSGKNLYWSDTSAGQIGTVGKTGTPGSSRFAAALLPRGIAADDSAVYWAESGSTNFNGRIVAGFKNVAFCGNHCVLSANQACGYPQMQCDPGTACSGCQCVSPCLTDAVRANATCVGVNSRTYVSGNVGMASPSMCFDNCGTSPACIAGTKEFDVPSQYSSNTFPAPTTGCSSYPDLVLSGGAVAQRTANGSPTCLGSVTIGAGSTLLLGSGDYVMKSLNLRSGGTLLAKDAGGPVRIWVQTAFALDGTVSTQSNSAYGSWLIYNGTQDCNLNGSSVLKGVVFTPAARINLNGRVYGAVVGGSVIMNGGSSVNYDPNLGC